MPEATTQEILKVTTPEFRASYVFIWEPRKPQPGEENKKPCYSVQALFDKTADLNALKALAQNALKKKFPDYFPGKPGFRSPFRDGDTDPAYAGKEECAGKVVVAMRSYNRQPGVVDQQCNPIIGKEDLYSGCYLRATVTAYAYLHGGNKGVSFSLQNVQKVRDGVPLSAGAAKAENDFEKLAPNAADYQTNNTQLFGDI
jgi:hypothetical protein